VEFRFFGGDLDPAEISTIIGLQSTRSSKGELIGRRRTPRFWGYNASDVSPFRDEWHSLEDGLMLVSRQLTPYRAIIIELSKRFEGVWWCGHFQYSADGGPTLSPEVLAAIAGFGCPLFIDCYQFCDDGDE
jgi:hypothetical protein